MESSPNVLSSWVIKNLSQTEQASWAKWAGSLDSCNTGANRLRISVHKHKTDVRGELADQKTQTKSSYDVISRWNGHSFVQAEPKVYRKLQEIKVRGKRKNKKPDKNACDKASVDH
jgi:hypothetical protein